MKRFLKYFICAALLAGVATGAALSINRLKQNDIKQAEAATLTGVFGKQEERYQSSTSDPTAQYLSRTSMATSSTWGGVNFKNTSGTLALTVNENSSNGNWHGIYVAFSYSITIPAYSSANIAFPCNLNTTKEAGGQADHIAEVQFYDSTSYDHLSLLNLWVEKDNPSRASNIATGFTDDSGVYRINLRNSGTQTGSHTFNKTLTNYTSSSTVNYLYFGFFAFVEQSSTNHQWYATLSINPTVTHTEYHASTTISGTTTYYSTFKQALYNATATSTIDLYASETYEEGFAINYDITLNLNGFTLTRSSAGASLFGVASNKTFRIVGGGGKLLANGNNCVIYVNEGGTLYTVNVTLENTQSGANCHAIQMNSGGGNLDLKSNTILKTSGGGNGIYTLSGGNNIKCQGVTTMTGTAPAINLNNATAENKNTLFIGGTCVFGSYISICNNAYTNLYTYCDGINYTGSQVINLNYQTLPTPNDIIFIMANNPEGTQTYLKFALKNAPTYMSIQRDAIDPSKARYAYVRYNVTINKTNVEGGSNSYYATHESDFSLTFTGTSNGFYALPSTIVVTIGGITKTAGTDYSWNQTTGVVTIFSSKILADITITINGIATNKKAVNDFVNAYMHMSDYTQNLGYCKDNTHHYYASAKQALLNLGSDCINEFRTNDAFTSALERYLAWANANNDTNPFEESSSSNAIKTIDNSYDVLLIIVISGMVISFAVVSILYLKKKHQK